MGERGEFNARSGKGFGSDRETVGESGHHTQYFKSGGTERLNGFQRTAAGGNEVFDHHHFGAFGQRAFDEIAHTVVLGLGTNVAHGQIKGIGHESPLCNGTCGHTGNGCGLRIALTNESGQLVFHKGANVRIGEGLSIVAIERTEPSAGPSEGLFGLEFDALNVEKEFGKLMGDGRHKQKNLEGWGDGKNESR